MQIFRSLAEIAPCQARDARRSVVTIGSFDGIHRAHQALLHKVCAAAMAAPAGNDVSVAVSFEPHPLAVLAPSRMPSLITPLPAKLELLAASGIELLLLIPFTAELASWSPEQFVREVLAGTLHARAVIVGENFRFGHRQAGTPDSLRQLGEKYSFTTEIFPKIIFRGRTVSSSEIRTLLEAGNISPANRLLGRPFCIRAPIAPGLGIGSKQTVPTYNLGAYAGLIPARGVYITTTRLFDAAGTPLGSGGTHSVTNIGTRPTFGEREIGLETHLLAPAADTFKSGHPVEMEVCFLQRLRDERKFDSPAALLSQIRADIERAQRYFRRTRHL